MENVLSIDSLSKKYVYLQYDFCSIIDEFCIVLRYSEGSNHDEIEKFFDLISEFRTQFNFMFLIKGKHYTERIALFDEILSSATLQESFRKELANEVNNLIDASDFEQSGEDLEAFDDEENFENN